MPETPATTSDRSDDAHDLVPRDYVLRDREAVRSTVMQTTDEMLNGKALDEETTDALDPILLARMSADVASLDKQREDHRLAAERIVTIAKHARDREAASIAQHEEDLAEAAERRTATNDAFRRHFPGEALPAVQPVASGGRRGIGAAIVRHRIRILQYGVLLVMVGGDYALLSLAVLELSRSLSALGSVGLITKILTVVLSAAMIVLPHVAATAAKNAIELRDRVQRYVALAAGGGWLLLLAMITIARAVAGGPTQSDSTLKGASVGTEAWSPWSSDSIFAWLTAIVLIGSGIYAFWLAWRECEPLASRYRAAARRHTELSNGLRAARVRHADSVNVLDIAETLDERDAEILAQVRLEVQAFYRLLRAEITTMITTRAGDPEATSHISRELTRLRSAPTHPLHSFPTGGAA